MADLWEDRLRSALAAGDFVEAQRLLPSYSQEIATLLSTASVEQERRQAFESFHNLLSLARVTRAHISAELSTLQRQASYRYHVPPSEQHAWRFEA